MRMPRFRIRTLMIAVAVVAVLTGAGVKWWRSALSHEYRWKAYVALHREEKHGGHSFWYHAGPNAAYISEGGSQLQPDPVLAEYYCRLRAKYERAARYPWFPVEPDPPPPE